MESYPIKTSSSLWEVRYTQQKACTSDKISLICKRLIAVNMISAGKGLREILISVLFILRCIRIKASHCLVNSSRQLARNGESS
jgi:hypothetical protein